MNVNSLDLSELGNNKIVQIVFESQHLKVTDVVMEAAWSSYSSLDFQLLLRNIKFESC